MALLPFIAFAQAPDTLWTRTFGGEGDDYAQDVLQTSDGGFIVAGHAGSDAVLVKLSSSGDTAWSHIYGGPAADVFFAVKSTDDKGFVLAGSSNSFGAPEGDVYFVRTDSLGNVLWETTCGGPYQDVAHDVVVTPDGGYVAVGYTGPTDTSSYDFFAVKVSSTGDSLWWRGYARPGQNFARSVELTSDSGLAIVGYSDATYRDVTYVIRTDDSGYVQWEYPYHVDYTNQGWSIKQTCDGGFLIASDARNTHWYILLTRINLSGDSVIWERAYSCDARYPDMDLCADGGAVIVAKTYLGSPDYGTGALIRTDSSGNSLWSGLYGHEEYGEEIPAAVQITRDGGFVIAGSSLQPAQSSYDFYVVRTGSEILGATLLYDSTGAGVTLRWRASVPCRYEIYSTLEANNDDIPPCQSWILEETMEGFCLSPTWLDSNPLPTYKKYVVVRVYQ